MLTNIWATALGKCVPDKLKKIAQSGHTARDQCPLKGKIL